MPLNWELITVESMGSINLDSIVNSARMKECVAYGHVLSAAIKDEAKWTPEQLECLRFLGAAMTMMLHPSEPSEPFGPMFVMGNKRSAVPADFPRDGLLKLLDWSQAIVDPELRARVLDVTWVQGKSFPAAQAAVDAYMESAKRLEDPKAWTAYANRLERGLRIAASLGKGGAALRESVLTEVSAAVRRYRGEDPLFLTHKLVGLLLEFGYGDAEELAALTLAGAARAEAEGDFWKARDYYQRAAECYAAAGDASGQADALRRSAEALAGEAESAVTQPQAGRGAIAGASIMAQAVNAMRQAPGGKERADELHERLIELQAKSLEQMKPVSTGGDAQELVERAIAMVSARSFREAVTALSEMAHAPSMDGLRVQVRKESRIAVLGSLFSNDIVNSRGRVVAKAPPLAPGVDDPSDDGLRFRMFRNAHLRRSITVQAMLNPARIEIAHAHNPARGDIVDLIRHSPWVPPGHAESIARALVAGFHGDLLIASHLVPPQMEAMVRHVVEIGGGSTSMFDPKGLQPEKSLNALLETPEAKKAFGESGVFELQDLFVDQLGTNLRNEVAHGLRHDSALFDSDALYAWWLLLRYSVLSSRHVENCLEKQARDSSEHESNPVPNGTQ